MYQMIANWFGSTANTKVIYLFTPMPEYKIYTVWS